MLRRDALLLIDAALAEDVGPGDFTTLWTVPEDRQAEAVVVAKASGVFGGCYAATETFRRVDPHLEIEAAFAEGTAIEPGDVTMTIRGSARSILTAERTALNFLQRLRAVEGTGARVIDTRKTTPGMRWLEKAAVAAGGGTNHRFGLHDMVMIKDNHIAAAGGITAAVEAGRSQNDLGLAVEVETGTLDEVREALAAGADRIMFDNMTPEMMREAVEIVRAHGEGRPETEASGGITLETIRAYAQTGVDYISIGALTHSAPSLDLSLRLTAL
jgi:nicotinate-nucleotide pyrophosphorylase (carboxylating)